MSEKGIESKCKFCSKNSSYTCPKCNAHYCSSKCYKCEDHLQCSEEFYKSLVEEQLKGATASEESKKKVLEALQRIEQSDSVEDLDSDDDEDLADRIKDIDLNDSDAVWSNLSPNEKQEFLELLKEGKTEDLIPPWDAWWDSNVTVTELKSSASKNVPSFVENCPPVFDCPPLSHLMKNEPSSSIPYNILNVLSSYVWTVRLFNGDHQENCVDASEAIFTLSQVLSVGVNYSSAEIAVNTPMVEAQNHTWLSESEEFSLSVKKDLASILKGPNQAFKTFYIAAALSDLHSMFTTCKQALVPRKKERSSGLFKSSIIAISQEITKKFTNQDLVKKSIKKIEFFLSYIKEYPYKLYIEI